MSLDILPSILAKIGGDDVAPALSMPAALPLELSGETVRPRLCMFNGPVGTEYALRADFTLPVALIEAERRRAGAAGEQVWRYDGPVFRLPSQAGDAVEFRQIGFEAYGSADPEAANKITLSLMLEAVQSVGLSDFTVLLGDLSIVPAIIDALNLSGDASSALKRAFRQPGGMTALLDRSETAAGSGFGHRLASLQEDDARAVLVETMSVAGISAIGTRSMDEVVERLIAQGRGAAGTQIPKPAREALREIGSIEWPVADVAGQLQAFCAKHAVVLPEVIFTQLAKRHSALPASIDARFTPSFGRQFTYYDGFVFDIFYGESCLGGGGRYDRLLEHVTDGEISAPAIGGALRSDRLERALGASV